MLINREKDFQTDTMTGGLEKLILGVQDYNWGKVTSSIQLINKFDLSLHLLQEDYYRGKVAI